VALTGVGLPGPDATKSTNSNKPALYSSARPATAAAGLRPVNTRSAP
jgi:hypothetical protein